MAQVEELKSKGNAALSAGNVEEAIGHYTDALNQDKDNHILYSNRSAAYCKAKKYEEALDDAETAIDLKPEWAKGHSRKGAALGFLNRHEESMMSYMEGLDHDPHNQQIKDAIKEAKSHLSGPAGSQPLVSPFADPQVWTKLENNSQTKEYLADPAYRTIIEKLQKNSSDLGKYMQDVRIMNSLGVLLGVDLNVMDGNGPGAGNMGTFNSDVNGHYNADVPSKQSKSQPARTTKVNGKKSTTSDLSGEQSEALQEKEKGNASYKNKEFETALTHYGRAVELDPTNIIFRNNKAAVYFEQGEYVKCIEECKEAVEIGRENRADFKLLAKAFSRIGNAYSKQADHKNALIYYNKSLSEHRDSDVVKKAVQTQKTMKEQEKLAYMNPDLSLEAKKLGNECFTKGDYPTAIKHYTEAIQRNPEDPKLFSNRAACFTKLAEFNMSLKDSDECIRLDPTFVKGYLRKGASFVAMKETSKAAAIYQKALEIDPNCQEAIDGYRKCCIQEHDPESVKRRAMQNPEVQQILADPAMQMILQQMQKDPKALQEHLKNPDIAKKIEKLLECGLIAIR